MKSVSKENNFMKLLTTSLLALSLLTGGSFVSSVAFAGKGKDCKCEECPGGKEGKCEHKKGKKGEKHECDCGDKHKGHEHGEKPEEKKAE
jgi:hypothetical protein